MSVITNNLLQGDDGYNISRSVRLRGSASATFTKTLASSGNLNKWTFSFWTKKAFIDSGTQGSILGCQSDANNFYYVRFSNGTTFNSRIRIAGTDYETNWTPILRDPSAWYHFVYVYDRQNATSADRQILYVNGVRQTTSSAANPTTDSSSWNVSGTTNYIGYAPQNAVYYDGNLAEFHYVDGQALAASSFGETDPATGVWKPKKYTGTYGTNGFFLNFSDNSSNTSTTIGKDWSGNGNNYTPNNISVTAGITYDSMLDVPTMWADGGNGRGNYGIINPLDKTLTDGSITNGNLTLNGPSNWNTCRGNWGMSSGKWYWETVHSSYNQSICGIADIDWPTSTYYPGYSSTGYSAGFGNAGYKYVDGAAGVVYGTAFTIGDVIGYALDMDAGTLTCYINGSSQGTMVTGLTGTIFPALAAANGATINANFGQRPFAYTPPTGFKALNTQNLPDATIKKGNAYFDATTYTGNGTSQSIINSGAMQPDLVWIKNRTDSATADHVVKDSVRGSFWLYTNTTDAEISSSQPVLAADGFSINSSANRINASGDAYVGWQWKESVSAGFDIVTYTGTGANRTVAHSLGVAPSLIILKQRSAVDYWVAWHSALSNTEYLLLNSTNAKATAATYWNSTSPTSSVFSLGTDSRPNGSGVTYVAYLFAEVAGYSKFGSYTGNGSSDGPFVYLGFRPKFVMWKISSGSTGDWYIIDSARDTYNAASSTLWPDLSNAEGTGANLIDFTSNGFKIRNAGGSNNGSGYTFIYAAFAENPFKNSLAR